MIYLYAYTNHKSDLDSLRRVKAIYDELKVQNIECEILVNEYRAQLLGRDWGLPLATTIETIKDIDAVASREDIILIDSPEELEGKVLNYPNYFKKVIYINSSCKRIDYKGAELFNVYLDEKFIYSILENSKKDKEAIYIYGDSDTGKTILKNSEIFKNKGLDLYWGIYFYVKYEDKLKEIFKKIVESEDYYTILEEYKTVYTSNIQIAIEAKANGVNTLFLELYPINECKRDLLKKYDIKVINNISKIDVIDKEELNLKNINKEIISIVKTYM